MRQELIKFEVNGRKYAVRTLSPDKAVSYGLKLSSILAPVFSSVVMDSCASFAECFGMIDDERIFRITEEARQCLFAVGTDGRDVRMSNPAEFNQWFSEYPEDLYEVTAKSVWMVAQDFFPPALRTAFEGIKSRASAAASAAVS